MCLCETKSCDVQNFTPLKFQLSDWQRFMGVVTCFVGVTPIQEKNWISWILNHVGRRECDFHRTFNYPGIQIIHFFGLYGRYLYTLLASIDSGSIFCERALSCLLASVNIFPTPRRISFLGMNCHPNHSLDPRHRMKTTRRNNKQNISFWSWRVHGLFSSHHTHV